MMCRATRPFVTWSSVAAARAVSMGATKPGPWAIRYPSRSVCAAAYPVTANPSADVDVYPTSTRSKPAVSWAWAKARSQGVSMAPPITCTAAPSAPSGFTPIMPMSSTGMAAMLPRGGSPFNADAHTRGARRQREPPRDGRGRAPGGRLAQARPRVHVEQDPATDRKPLGHDCDRLADDLEIAPALGQATLTPVRRAAALPVDQVHRLARAVGGVHRGQPAPGPLRERGLPAGRDGVPDLGDHRGAAGAAGVQDRVGAADGVLHLRVLAEPAGPAARRLLGGQFDERVDPGARNAGDHRAVMGPDPGLGRQRVRDSRPVAPLVVERHAGVDHRAPLRQEDVVERPVEAAGGTEPGHVPASRDDLRFGAMEDAAPVDRGAIRAAA